MVWIYDNLVGRDAAEFTLKEFKTSIAKTQFMCSNNKLGTQNREDAMSLASHSRHNRCPANQQGSTGGNPRQVVVDAHHVLCGGEADMDKKRSVRIHRKSGWQHQHHLGSHRANRGCCRHMEKTAREDGNCVYETVVMKKVESRQHEKDMHM